MTDNQTSGTIVDPPAPGQPAQATSQPPGQPPAHGSSQGVEVPAQGMAHDPEALARNMLILFHEGGKTLATYLEKQNTSAGPYSMMASFTEAAKAVSEVATHWMKDPARFAELQRSLTQDYLELWSRTLKRSLGEQVPPVVEPDQTDNRFKDPDWSNNPFYDFMKQAYLLSARFADDFVSKADGLDDDQRRRAEFYIQQVASAVSPSNFAGTNPEVVRETLATNAENLVNGLHLLANDVNRSKDLLRVSQSDLDAFKVGETLAITPGKVIFQNDIIQLIQYAPSTPQAFATPLLIVPPWINKFYVLDLIPKKSLMTWLVAQGYTVFVISWVNPDPALRAKTFEDYMHDGILTAVDVITRQTEQPRVNTLGYCVGGTLLASTLAYMAAKGDDRINASGFMTTQVDFTNAGDLRVFIDDAQLGALEDMMSATGFLDGSRMATAFNMLRPRDLIWHYFVNNYLLGRKPMPFDMLYWNQDSTRMPAANHAFYLREFYQHNRLAKGEMVLGGVKLDLGKITVPIYDLATKEDHIAPALSVYRGAKLFGGPVRFVLAGSGHIAGVVNPPDKVKYQYWTHDRLEPTLEDWTAAADVTPGSWWPDFSRWLSIRSGPEIPARDPAVGAYRPIEDAPGSYVRVRI